MTGKYADDQAIRDKIQELFADRKMFDLLRYIPQADSGGLLEQLNEIQFRIYLLDACLESQYDLNKEQLEEQWRGIYKAIDQAGYDAEAAKALLQEIYAYEKIEKKCRVGKWPTSVSFTKFYTIKSCDVRLMRRLLYASHPALNDIWKEKAWLFYDRITEVNDDVADLSEDIETWNGNRFMFAILQQGIYKASQQYEKKLRKINSKADRYFHKHGENGHHRVLHAWTLQRAEETLEALKNVGSAIAPEKLSMAYWLAKMD